jgi:hypothetical protein
MSANSTLLASLTLQVQDNENSGQTIVNRQVPQFSFQAVQSPYASYVTVQPGSSVVLVPNTALAYFFFIRNATTPTTQPSAYVLDVSWFDVSSGENNNVGLTPGGWIMKACQNAGNSADAGSLFSLSIGVGTGGQPIVAEYLFAG